jgi:acyl-[acyl-carrier-protein] desaturase
LKVLELSRLAAEGLRAQDEIGMFMGELNDQAARFDERREALLARRWTY